MKSVLSFLLIVSIAVSPTTAQEGEHPRAALVPGTESISFTLGKDLRPENVPKALRRRAAQLRQAEQAYAIGKREGEVEEMFGEVADIEVSSNGQIYVLDERYSEIRQYNGDGERPVQIMGGPGQGPKEFKAPTELTLLGNTLLAVLDPQRIGLKIFRRTASGIQHRRTIRHGMPTSHMCSLGDRIVLQGIRPPKTRDAELERKSLGARPILHLYGLDGTLRKSFGDAYQSEDELLSLQISEGPVACVEDAEMIVTALEGTSLLYGYRPSGERAWVTQIEEYIPNLVRKEGRKTIFVGGHTEDMTYQIRPLSTGEVLVQVIHRTPNTRTRDYLNTYLVAPSTGQGVYVGKELPTIMEAHGNRLYAGVDDPYPQVKIYEFGQ